MSAVPTLKEELDRKAFETVEWLFSGIDKGKLTPAQFSTGIDVLFMAVNGLVAEGVADLITAGDEAARHEQPTVRQTLIKGNRVIAITWLVGNELVEIVGYESGKETTRQDKIYDTPKQACAAMKAAADKLVAAGYLKL